MTGERLLGRIASQAKTGHVIVEVHDPNMSVKLGSRVRDSSRVDVGIIVDLIGNVEKPYAVVKWLRGEPPRVSETLYIAPAERRGAGKARGGKRGRSGRGRGGRRVPTGGSGSHPRRS